MKADLLQDFHSELRCDRSARNKLVERVCQSHADAT